MNHTHDIMHSADCGIRDNMDQCGFGCHGTEHANLLNRLHANEALRRQWSWVKENWDIARHRAVVAAVKLRKIGWSIIEVDNYDRDYKTEVFIEGDHLTESAARERRDFLVANTLVGQPPNFLKYDEHSDCYLTVRHGSKGYYVFAGY